MIPDGYHVTDRSRSGYLLVRLGLRDLPRAGRLPGEARHPEPPRPARPDRGRHGAAGRAAWSAGRPLATTIHFVRGDDTILTGAQGRPRGAAGSSRAGGSSRSRSTTRAGHAILEPLYRQVATHRRRIGPAARSPGRMSAPAAEGRDRLTLGRPVSAGDRTGSASDPASGRPGLRRGPPSRTPDA